MWHVLQGNLCASNRQRSSILMDATRICCPNKSLLGARKHMLRQEIEMGLWVRIVLLLHVLPFRWNVCSSVSVSSCQADPIVSSLGNILSRSRCSALHGFGGHSSTLILIRNEWHWNGNGSSDRFYVSIKIIYLSGMWHKEHVSHPTIHSYSQTEFCGWKY